MANVGTLSIKFTGDARQLENTFTKVGIKANLFASAIQSGLRGAISVAKDFVGSAISIAQTNESTLTSFKNLTGSIGEARDLYKNLLDFAAKTPFSTQQINSGAITLLGFGLSAKDATSAIKDLGAAAAANADTDLKRLVVSFGQIQGANVAMTKDLREFVNNGIPIYQLLSETLGVSVSEINKLASQGKITGDIITKTFKQAASEGGRFANTLIDQSKTLRGLTSTLKDNFAIALGKIGDNVLPAVKLAAVGLNEALIDIQSFLESPKFQQAAVQAGAFLKAAFISATTEISLEFNNTKLTFLELVKFFQQQATSLSGLKFGSKFGTAFIFSDEDRENSINNLKEVEEGIANATARIAELSGSDKRFAVQFEVAKKEAEELLKTLGDVSGATSNLGDQTKDTNNGLDDGNKKVKEISLSYAEMNERIHSLLPNLKLVAEAFRRQAEAQAPLAPLPERTPFIAPSIDVPLAETDEERADRIKREKEAQDAFNSSLSLGLSIASQYGSALSKAYAEGATGARAYARAALETAKEVIGAKIREGVISYISGILQGPAGKVPILGLALAAAGGIAAEAFFRSILSKIKIPAFGDGGVVYGPTLALIGEKGPEAIVPLNGNSRRDTMNVNIRGVEYGGDRYWLNEQANIIGRLTNG